MNGFIAVSSNVTRYPIVIVNPVNYTVMKEIKVQKIITHYSFFVWLMIICLFMFMMELLFKFRLMRIIKSVWLLQIRIKDYQW